MAHQRCLILEGGHNFRDLGGISTSNGKKVKKGLLIRGDELNKLTPADIALLSALPLVTLVDFRGPSEIEKAPDIIPLSVKQTLALSIDPGKVTATVSSGHEIHCTPEAARKIMLDIYTALITNPYCIGQYKKFFALLSCEQNAPLLFHCTAGKDRTGIASALILLALGVSEDIIMQDYLFTNNCLAKKYAALIEREPALKDIFEARAEYLETALALIKKSGGAEAYLTKILCADLDKLRSIYLN